MSTGQLRLTLTNSTSGRTITTLGMVEITPAFEPELRHVDKQARDTVRIVLSAMDEPTSLSLDTGPYIVRISFPNGVTQAERINMVHGETIDVVFRADDASSEWYGDAGIFGIAARRPRLSELESILVGLREPRTGVLSQEAPRDLSLNRFVRTEEQNRQLAWHNWYSLERQWSDLARISGEQIARRARGWSWTSHVDEERQIPKENLQGLKLVQWWTGEHQEPYQRLMPAAAHDYEVHLEAGVPDEDRMWNLRRKRVFAAVRDPIGNEFYAVFPEGWQSRSPDRMDTYAKPSILLTATVETALDRLTSAAKWQCMPQVDDVDAMGLLGFLQTEQTGALHSMMLGRAHRMLFSKDQNPVAAAAGAYALLSMNEEANSRFDQDWRWWVRNLYRRFPHIPDGAIAMAQLALSFGTETSSKEVDVEEVRTYALQAVRRGLPYLGVGIPRLTDILTMLESDDRTQRRHGALVEDTRKALSLVRQLGQITVPGSLFTVLRLREVNNVSDL